MSFMILYQKVEFFTNTLLAKTETSDEVKNMLQRVVAFINMK